jgi:hypothetical protein
MSDNGTWVWKDGPGGYQAYLDSLDHGTRRQLVDGPEVSDGGIRHVVGPVTVNSHLTWTVMSQEDWSWDDKAHPILAFQSRHVLSGAGMSPIAEVLSEMISLSLEPETEPSIWAVRFMESLWYGDVYKYLKGDLATSPLNRHANIKIRN